MIDIRELSLAWNGRTILDRVTLSLHDGEIAGIIGPPGAGKSLLLRALAGRLTGYRGEITINGKPGVPGDCSLMSGDAPQDRDDTTGHFVLTARLPRRRFFTSYSDYDRQVADDCLAAFGLADRRDERLGRLTGDELRRSMLAHIFAREAGGILLDEPTAGLSIPSVLMLKRALTRHAAGGRQLAVIASHDLGFIGQNCDRIIIMHRGRIAEEGGVDLLTPERVRLYFGAEVLISRNVYNGRPEIHLFPES